MKVVVDGLELAAHLARPPRSAANPVSAGVLIAHGLPMPPHTNETGWRSFPELADRIAADCGWVALTVAFRGIAGSPGSFSPTGWQRDLAAAVEALRGTGVSGVWLCGFGIGGTLSVVYAAEHDDIRGVATFAATSDLEAWTAEERRVTGLDSATWASETRGIRPLVAARSIPPRPFLIVHGADDPDVSVFDSRAMGDAAEGHAELRILPGAAHALRHDPRAIAILLGWLDRQVVGSSRG